MRFLRTTSTRRLLAIIAGLVIAAAGGTAIAVAATSGGAVPPRQPLARSLHAAAAAPAVAGLTAHIKFTNGLISSEDFTDGASDPILQGASGRIWLSSDHRMRLELQSDQGDAQVVVDGRSFWVSDPSSQTVYEGTLPADAATSPAGQGADSGVPTVAELQSDIAHLLTRADIAGVATSDPTNVAGRAAYSVSISPKHDGGQLGAVQLAWDALNGVPLKIAIYARGNSSPVLALEATDISYGPVAASVFAISPPAGAKVVKVAAPTGSAAGPAGSLAGRSAKRAEPTGPAAVAARLPFKLVAPASLVGLPRQSVRLLDAGGRPGALITYGENLGGVLVVEQPASGGSAGAGGSGGDAGSLSLPSVSIKGVTGHELGTALGTVLTFTRNGVSYTVAGSVAPYAAEAAARALR